MKARIIDFAQELSARGQQVADMANERSRGAVTQAAALLTDSKGPIEIAAKFANGLNDVNHRYIRKVVKLNGKALQGSVDGGIKRLKAAGSAKDLRSLYQGQLDFFTASRDRLVDDFREGLKLARETGTEVKDLFVMTIEDLRGKKPTKNSAAKAKTAAKKSAAPKKAAPGAIKKAVSVAGKKVTETSARASSAAA